ncbi:unnamed protein product [Didymodactylos carnosus]|uniref:G domain-containing protein n=1 Tax=Didymodactylos carnosus TaxID=1234261 RepID=A0A815JK06_9BILA|nr:unnamed protein product [Didymodactylos carnosus]CAF1380463.1 unnamed protein product [Didymodactylos carnosus]CAF3579850.1 unnamed protein product [Didymodactylos carnosus]CAF4274555.1 unnamed protein product [Didymodactylos carnosus]
MFFCLYIFLEKFNEQLIQYERNMHNKLTFENCTVRNIVLLGRTRVGKTTLAQVLKHLRYVPPQRGLHIRTREIEFINIASTSLKENQDIVYNFNIVDTPGFYQTIKPPDPKLSNQGIINLIDDYLANDRTQIHIWAFVVNFHDGFSKEDLETMILIKTHYPTLHQYMSLVITQCETAGDKARQNFVNTIFDNPDVRTHQLKNYFGLQVYFMGCLRPETSIACNLQAAKSELANVATMRENFIKLCINRKDDQDYSQSPLILSWKLIQRLCWRYYKTNRNKCLLLGGAILIIFMALIMNVK